VLLSFLPIIIISTARRPTPNPFNFSVAVLGNDTNDAYFKSNPRRLRPLPAYPDPPNPLQVPTCPPNKFALAY
jgi:hypothetical protein